MTGSVQLAGEQSGTSVLHRVLSAAADAFHDDFANALPKSTSVFRKAYPQVLPRFESLRLASPHRHAIAKLLAATMQDQLVWRTDHEKKDQHEEVLRSWLASAAASPLALKSLMSKATESGGWQAGIDYDDRHWSLREFPALAARLQDRRVISHDAAGSLSWLSEHCGDAIDLGDRKIVVMGASAEMAPTASFLAAGAEVLWLDVVPPSNEFLDSMPAGTLHFPPHGADLLTQPDAILATINAFAGEDAVDLALYAYAPGKAREVRLTGTMNAIVNAMPANRVRSVTLLVSPTTPTALDSTDLDAMSSRQRGRPRWEATLATLHVLGAGGAERIRDSATTRTVVSIQGSSYQAAQYLGKVIAAECWATHGAPHGDYSPLRVSANTAAITKTRSLEHPVFDAAFGGAAAFGIETFTPEQSRQANGVLAVKDWLSDTPPVPGRVRVHGGIHTLPYPLESAMLSAAAIGFARKPSLLMGLLKRQ